MNLNNNQEGILNPAGIRVDPNQPPPPGVEAQPQCPGGVSVRLRPSVQLQQPGVALGANPNPPRPGYHWGYAQPQWYGWRQEPQQSLTPVMARIPKDAGPRELVSCGSRSLELGWLKPEWRCQSCGVEKLLASEELERTDVAAWLQNCQTSGARVNFIRPSPPS
ncbi:uncharacterized protein [Neodiprion pinetum]|uniref:uncharacterized protein n=1 Tax=Neodiprion pinetum TaxID=441929 RepID=UPI0037205B5E